MAIELTKYVVTVPAPSESVLEQRPEFTVYDDAVFTGATTTAAVSIAASTNRYFSGKCIYRYFRVRISTAFTGGTVQAFTTLSILDYVPRTAAVGNATTANLQSTVTQTGTWTVQPGNTANTTAWLMNIRGGTTGGHIS